MSVKRCDRCGGRGTVTDYSGMGTGSLSCSYCNGSGQVLSFANDDAPTDTGGGFEGVSGTAYFVFILIFVGFCVGGVNELIDYFDIQFINKEYLLYGTVAVSIIVGIIIRNILAMIAGIVVLGVMLFLGWAIISAFIEPQENDKESNNEPATYVEPRREDALALAKRIMAEEHANLEAARKNPPKPLSAEERADMIAIGKADLQKQLAKYNLPEDIKSQCVICKDYMEAGMRYDTPRNNFLNSYCVNNRGNCAANGVRY